MTEPPHPALRQGLKCSQRSDISLSFTSCDYMTYIYHLELSGKTLVYLPSEPPCMFLTTRAGQWHARSYYGRTFQQGLSVFDKLLWPRDGELTVMALQSKAN